jgi:hypothetical protein
MLDLFSDFRLHTSDFRPLPPATISRLISTLLESLRQALEYPRKRIFLLAGWPILPALPSLDPAVRRELLWRCADRVIREKQDFNWLLTLCLLAGMALSMALRRLFNLAWPRDEVPGIIVFTIVSVWIHSQTVARRIRPVVREELRKVGLCTTCGFDLRATPACCPECGMAPD